MTRNESVRLGISSDALQSRFSGAIGVAVTSARKHTTYTSPLHAFSSFRAGPDEHKVMKDSSGT